MSGIVAAQLLGPSTGGIRVHVARLAEGLRDRGLLVPVLGPAGVLGDLGPQAGVVPVPGGTSPAGLVRARRALVPWRARVSVIHAHGLKAGWVAIGGRPRRPVVVTVHNVVLDDAAGRAAGLQRRLERAVLRRADRVVVPTDAMAARLPGVAEDRIRVVLPVSPAAAPVRSRAEVRAAWGLGEHTPVVVCVARLHPQKDLPTLLAAWEQVVAAVPEARLVLVGEGPLVEPIRSGIVDRGLDASVRLAGFSAHAVDELGAADVAVLTSVWEAVPLVLLEALALGVPVVSTDVGLAAALLGDGAAGAVVPVGDAAGVARGLSDLLGDPGRRAAAATAAREVVAPYLDEAALVDGVLDVYRELV